MIPGMRVSPTIAIVLLAVVGLSGAAAQEPIDAEGIHERNVGAVLVVEGLREGTNIRVQGSGCCVDTRGLVLVTAHQVVGVRELRGRLVDGATCALRVVEARPELELALLQADRPLPVAARLGDARLLRNGAPLVSIAAPSNLSFSTVTGTVSATNRIAGGYAAIQAVLTATHGSSGGPVFDRNGLLIGLISGELKGTGFTLINNINNAYALLEEHGIARDAPPPATGDEDGDLLAPAPGITSTELHAIQAYNRGVSSMEPAAKAEAYALAVKLLPDFYEAWFNLGVVSGALGAVADAEAAYQRAATLSTESPAALRNLGLLYLAQGDVESAIAAFTTALRRSPASAQLENDLGEALRTAKRLEEARAAFRRAIGQAPDYAPAHYNLALTLAALDDDAGAATHLEEYLRLRPGDPAREEVEAWLETLRLPAEKGSDS